MMHSAGHYVHVASFSQVRVWKNH